MMLSYYLDPKSMQSKAPQPAKGALRAIILRSVGVPEISCTSEVSLIQGKTKEVTTLRSQQFAVRVGSCGRLAFA